MPQDTQRRNLVDRVMSVLFVMFIIVITPMLLFSVFLLYKLMWMIMVRELYGY